ncbi:MAG: AAA family ATPase [Spirochaetes bacterium]|nr:AAA family ATPase [Spirochaetota bacterium]
MNDSFGLDGEIKILESNIRNIFTPHQPINSKEFFFGRTEQVSKVIQSLNTPGLHFLLYGERGVGKSSLGNITVELVINTLYKDCTFVKRCDRQTTIEELFEKPLASIGVNVFEVSSITKELSGINAGLDFKVVKINGSDGNEKQITYKPNSITPSYISEKLASKKGVLFIDEFDSLSKETKEKVGELVKLLSDEKSPFKLLIVGVGNSIAELMSGNASISRHVKQIKLSRMTNDEIKQLVVSGSSKIGLTYNDDVINKILDVSSGYPHFAHLLALKSGEKAIKNNLNVVEYKLLIESINDSIQDTEEFLQHTWNSTMQTLQSEIYLQILMVCAALQANEIKAKVLREKLLSMFNLQITQNELNQYLIRLVADDESKLLHRITKGIYRFSDPRMSSFVKLKTIENM